jgi:hypothetical protein
VKDGNTLNCDENNAQCSIVSSDVKTTISFPDISPKMSGSYECHATNDAGSSTRRRILKVNHDPPKISQVLVKGESSKIMNLGDEKFLILEDSNEILLECQATGWPTPSSVTFTRSGIFCTFKRILSQIFSKVRVIDIWSLFKFHFKV